MKVKIGILGVLTALTVLTPAAQAEGNLVAQPEDGPTNQTLVACLEARHARGMLPNFGIRINRASDNQYERRMVAHVHVVTGIGHGGLRFATEPLQSFEILHTRLCGAYEMYNGKGFFLDTKGYSLGDFEPGHLVGKLHIKLGEQEKEYEVFMMDGDNSGFCQ